MEGDAIYLYPGACAACKHQRKRCDENCQLARYFPANRIEDFRNVYRLFGVSNVLKLLNVVSDDEKDKAVESLILEARIRTENPVHGSLAVEKELRDQIEISEKELQLVQKQLSMYKEIKNLENLKEHLEAHLDESALTISQSSQMEQNNEPSLATPHMPQQY